MSVRKYWRRHPIQLRVTAAVLLVFIPVILPIGTLVFYWSEVLEAIADQYKQAWSALVRGE